MKTLTLNIGLTKNTGGRLAPHTAICTLANRFNVLQSRVCASPNGDEQVLVAVCELPQHVATYPGLLPDEINPLCGLLKQDCIAIQWSDGTGELIGPKAEEWGEFNPAFFVGIDGETLDKSNVSEENQQGVWDGLSARRSTEQAEEIDAGLAERIGFVQYLTETLIPDLKESGFEATAEDFETALKYIR